MSTTPTSITILHSTNEFNLELWSSQNDNQEWCFNAETKTVKIQYGTPFRLRTLLNTVYIKIKIKIKHGTTHKATATAQRQRNGHNILVRGSGSNNSGQIMPPARPQQFHPQAMTISDQVEYAMFAQHLKYLSKRPSKYLKSMGGSAMATRNSARQHTGYKKGNYDRHLLCDHNNVGFTLSLYVLINEVAESIKKGCH